MRKLLLVSLMCLLVHNLFSQEQSKSNEKLGWFGAIGGGINYYVGEHDKYASFSDRIAPALDLSFGTWVSPLWGFRGQYAGLKAKGVSGQQNGFTTSETIDGRYVDDFNVMSLHADAMLNFSNWVGGVNNERFYQLIPFMGFGWAISWTEDAARTTPTLNAGLINQFRISPKVNLNLEMRGMAVSEDFDILTGGRKGEGMGSLTLGVTYRFGKGTPKTEETKDAAVGVEPQAEVVTPEEQIAQLEEDIANKDRLIKQLYSDLEAERAKMRDSMAMASAMAQKQAEQDASKLSIFFPIGATLLDGQDIINLGSLAERIKASSTKYTITGYADAGTGSAARNKYLSDKRAHNVYNILVDKYKVNPELLEIVAKGGSENVYDMAELNRVVVIEAK